MEENKFNQIIKSDSFALISDFAEISLDSLAKDEIIKDIPMIGTISKLLSIGTTINDRLFTKKLFQFLKELEDINQDLILKEINYIDDSERYTQKVGEKLLEIITRIDSDEKPKIVGRLFKSFLLKEIDYNKFLKLSHLVENVFLLEILVIKEAEKYPRSFINKLGYEDYMYYLNREKISQELYSYGIVENINPDAQPFPNNEFKNQNVKLLELGINLFKFGLK
ncbi:hypothetical protein [Chryseobacterium foetidum]|uniref:hypothetical protein n=1 Tax=Chryseobacterium foetidum TaxID=2951057 RepID=UPI0021CA0F2B|nr:hypothetical protein [Chryseobacterium foetidum]